MTVGAASAYTAPDEVRGLRGWVAAVITLGILAVALAVAASSLWFSAGLGLEQGNAKAIRMPETLGRYTTVTSDVRRYHWSRSAKSYQQAYNAAAAVHEYASTDGRAFGVTVVMVRAKLPAPEPSSVLARRDAPTPIKGVGGGLSCVGPPARQPAGASTADGPGVGAAEAGDDGSAEDSRRATRCVKSTPLLSVDIRADRPIPTEDAQLLAEELWRGVPT